MPRDRYQLALYSDGLLGGFRHDAELAQKGRHVVVPALLHDLPALVEPREPAATHLIPLVRRGQHLPGGRLEWAGLRPGQPHLVRAVPVILLERCDEFHPYVREASEEPGGVLPDGLAPA